MRICDLTNLYIDNGEGGVNTYLYEKARYLAQNKPDFEHYVIVPGEKDDCRKLFNSQLITIKSPRYFRNPQHRILFNRKAIQKHLRDVSPDLIEVDSASKLAHIAQAAFNSYPPPIVGFYHVHLPTFFAREFGKTFGHWAGQIIEKLAWRMVKGWVEPCESLIVTSKDILERLQEKNFKRLEYIPLGVNTELFRPLEEKEMTERKGPRTILYVGRLSREKHLHVLFEAYELLKKQPKDLGDLKLKIVGDGPMLPLIEKKAAEDSTIEYAGLCPYGETLAEHYRNADLLALPSPSETFGLSLLEALASGLPVVAIRRGGPSGLITGDLGSLALPDDPKDFAQQIENVLQASPASENRRRYIEEKFSWKNTFETLLNVYTQALARK